MIIAYIHFHHFTIYSRETRHSLIKNIFYIGLEGRWVREVPSVHERRETSGEPVPH
jgi:hypothetical protein